MATQDAPVFHQPATSISPWRATASRSLNSRSKSMGNAASVTSDPSLRNIRNPG